MPLRLYLVGGGGSRSGGISPRIIFSKFSKNAFDNLLAVLVIRRLPNWAILLPGFSLCRIAQQGEITICDQFNISLTFGKASDTAIAHRSKAKFIWRISCFQGHLTRKFGLYWPDFKHNTSLKFCIAVFNRLFAPRNTRV